MQLKEASPVKSIQSVCKKSTQSNINARTGLFYNEEHDWVTFVCYPCHVAFYNLCVIQLMAGNMVETRG